MSDAIRVLVVDDSAFMRRAIARMLTAEPGIEVVGSVADGQQALEAVKTLRPDVVTLDIEMPVMDGLTTLKRLMAETPLPVIMMSTLTQNGATATVTALSSGAFDFVPKPEGSMIDVFGVEQDLRAKVRAAAGRRRPAVAIAPVPPARVMPPEPVRPGTLPRLERPDLIAIGISTGGPPALQVLLEALPADFPIGIVIVQHMPPGFTRPLAERLDRHCPIEVRESAEGMAIRAGRAVIAAAGQHLTVRRNGTGYECRQLDASGSPSWHKPSVDVLFASVAQEVGAKALAVVMTGMGSDGTAGAAALKARGAAVWAQDEGSSVVYGMPRAVAEAGWVDRVLALSEISLALKQVVR
jgi:two-component system chemotaxis response regulator CheB